MGKTVKCNSRSSDSITKACYVITIVSLFQINNFIICDSIFEERQKYTGSVIGKSRKTKKRWKIDAMSEKESPTVQNELDLDSLVNQLSASTEYNDLRQKMNKIEKSKVSLSPLPNHPIDEGVRRIAQTTA